MNAKQGCQEAARLTGRHSGGVRRLPVFAVALLISGAGLLATFPVQASTTVVGTIPGSFGVSPTGAATYSIPINVPRGAGGLTPSITLVYNSQSGEGAAGYGWTLSGLSAITRCNKTIDDDGSTEGVTLTSTDDYCLDGQRLLSTGTNTYDTEIRQYDQITATSGTNGPDHFEVQTTDGKTYEYGNTTDSKILATGTSTVRIWALDKVRDANGNYYTFTYQNNDTTTGDYWPLSIAYTGNTTAGNSPLHTITFAWTPRSDNTVQTTFVEGTLISQTQLLSMISVNYNGAANFAYTLSYQTDSGTGRNQLYQVQECAANGSCFPPTMIAWQNGAAGWQSDISTGAPVSNITEASAAHLMDINGDGIMDLLYPNTVGSTTDWWVMFGLPGGGFGAPVDTGIAAQNYQYALVLDYDGDGRQDLIQPDTTDNYWHVLKATGNTSGTIFTDITTSLSDTGTNSVTNEPIYEGNAMTADYHGNGLSDFIYSDGTNIYDVVNTGGSFGTATNIGSEGVISVPAVGIKINPEFQDAPLDFDGSGRIGNLVVSQVTRGTTTTYDWDALASATAGYVGVGGISAPQGDIVVPTPVDANGSGMADLLWAGPSGTSGSYYWNVNLSTGTGLLQVSTPITDGGDGFPIMADYYGDGRQEMMVIDDNAAWWMIRINYDPSALGFTAQVTSTVNPCSGTAWPGTLRVGNIGALGLDDLVYAVASGSTYTWHYRLHAVPSTNGPDLVTQITDGLGNTFSPSYAPLSATLVYTEGSGAIYPNQDVKKPFQVVTSYQASNGIGSTYTESYTYSGAEMEVTGHGFLGFASRTATDSRNSVEVTDSYNQAYPWIGNLTQEAVTESNGKSLSETIYTYASSPSSCTGGVLCFAYLSQSKSEAYDVTTGDLIKTVKTQDTGFDGYGDVTNQVITITDNTSGAQFVTTMVTSYADDTSSYCIDLPTSISVTKQSAGGSMVRETTTVPASNCAPQSATVSQGSDSAAGVSGTATPVTTTYTYDDWGNSNTITVSASGLTSRSTTTDFTSYNGEYFDKVTNALGQSMTETWNPALGVKNTLTDVNGHTTTWGYDDFGRKTSEQHSDGTVTTWTKPLNISGGVCPSGVSCYTVSASENVGSTTIPLRTIVYDAEGRAIEQQKTLLGGAVSSVETTYNALGQVTGVSKPFFESSPAYWNYSSYDVLGRPLTITAPASARAPSGDVTMISYSGFTTTVSTTAPNTAGISNETAITTTDALGEIISKTDGSGSAVASSSYTYDPFGDLLSTTDADGHTTSMSYDGLGHKTGMIDPDMGSWNYQVDALGELLTQTDAKGQKIMQSYDVLGRLTSRIEDDTSGTVTVSDAWTYDTAAHGVGLLATESDSNGFSKSYTYDSLSRPEAVDTTIPGTDTPYAVDTSYDSFGRVSTVTYPASVAPSVPVANAVATPTSATVGNNITLNGSGSTDPNGLSLSYQWSQTTGPVAASIAAPTADITTVTTSAAGAYTFQLVVSDQNASSSPAVLSVTFYLPVPSAPSISPSPSYNGSYTVSWSPVTGTTSYNVYESINGGAYTELGSVSGTSDALSGKTSGTYSYEITACENAICSNQSTAASVQVILPPGTVPPGSITLSPNPSTTGSYTLTWGAVTGATSYDIYLSANGGGFSLLISTAATSYAASESDGSYGYYLTACDAAGCSNPSATVTESVTVPPGTPGTPSGTPNPSTTGSFTMSWTAPSGAYTSMQLEESPNETTWTTEATSGTTWSGSGFSNGTYYFKTVYCDGSACSSSAVGSVTVLLPPSAPTGLAISPPGQNGTGSYTVSWTASATATSYQVYRSTGGAYSEIATPGSASYAVSGEGNGTYYYYVEACNASGCSGASATLTVTVLLLPGKPSSLSIAPNPATAFDPFTLTWGSASGTVSYYIIDGITSQHYTTRSYTNPGRSHGSYSYWVQACNSSGCGPDSVTVIETVNPGGGGTKLLTGLSTTSSKISRVPPTYNGSSDGTGRITIARAEMLSASQHSYNVLVALAKEKHAFDAGLPRQPLESQMQAEARKRARAQLPSLLPPAPTEDVVAWNAWDAAHKRAYPKGPNYAPPEYIAYADAKLEPTSGTSNRFEVQYIYDPASGALAAVENAQTGFVYWQADTGEAAPVDAYGHLLAWTDGNNVSTVMAYDAATGVPVGISSGVATSSSVQQLAYSWDGYGNLEERQDANRSLTETFQYDDLNRLTDSAVTNPAANGPGVMLSYDAMGNILTKSNMGTYTYDPNHPYAVNTVTNGATTIYSASYDADGNMAMRNGSPITWTVDNLPESIAATSGSSTFSYGPDHGRYQQVTTYNGLTTTTTYISGLFEIVATATSTEYRHNIMAGGQMIAVHTIDQSGAASTNYLHYDHLGSVDTITDNEGNVIQSMSFDAFGLRRDATSWDYDLTSTQIAALKDNTDRGYTDQEELDNVTLVDLNGRVYDPDTGRFISADPVQPGNRYMYVGDNPLAYTDPTGYCWAGCFWQPSKLASIIGGQSNLVDMLFTGLPSIAWRTESHAEYELAHNRDVQVVAAVALAAYTGGASLLWLEGMGADAFWATVGEGAVAGGVFSGAMGIASGQSPAEIVDETLRGAVTGAVSSGLLYGADSLTTYANNNFAVGFVSHGVAGGLSSVAAGGSFNKGFELGGIAYTAQDIYTNLTKPSSASLAPAQNTTAVYKCQGCTEDNAPNQLNWGDANPAPDPSLVGTPVTIPTCGGLLCEGGTISKVMNYVPVMPATSLVHDIIGDMAYGTATVPAWFNYATMVPAFALSTLAVVSSSMGSAIMTANTALNRGGGG